MTLELQHIWGNLIVIDLFLGGLGGTCLALAAIALHSKRLLPIIAPLSSATLGEAAEETGTHRHDRTFALIMSLSGVVFVGLGVLMLLLDLLHPEAAFHLLGNPSSWMFWGTIFITITLISGALYGWAQAVPTLEWLYSKASLRRGKQWSAALSGRLASAGKTLQGIERVTGAVAGILGFAYAFYTGLLLTMAPAVPFWHTPALPCLFMFSAFSAAIAYALWLFWRSCASSGERESEAFKVLMSALSASRY